MHCCDENYSVGKKFTPVWVSKNISPNGLQWLLTEVLQACLFYVHIYAKIQKFIQLSLNLTKICHFTTKCGKLHYLLNGMTDLNKLGMMLENFSIKYMKVKIFKFQIDPSSVSVVRHLGFLKLILKLIHRYTWEPILHQCAKLRGD